MTSLDDLRREINAIDDQLHDLLMRRADYAAKVAAQKKAAGAPLLQPGREIAVINRLLARHEGPLPRESLVRIWRELIGALSLLQLNVRVVVAAPPDDAAGFIFWDMAKDHFASITPMVRVGNALSALSMVRDGEVTFAVLPRPIDDEGNPWWRFLPESGDGTEPPLRIVARLPIADRSRVEARPEHDALVVARLPFESSGNDRSFVVFDLDATVSRTRVVDRCQDAGVAARALWTSAMRGSARLVCLTELDGFIGEGDPRLTSIATKLDPHGRAFVVGGYPVPLVFDDRVGKNAVPGDSLSPVRTQ